MSMTNTSPISFPTRSAVPALGTNPISLAAPGTGDDSFVLDMASTTVAIGKVLIGILNWGKSDGWGVWGKLLKRVQRNSEIVCEKNSKSLKRLEIGPNTE